MTLYIPGDGFLYRLNPVTKLVFTLCIALVAFGAPGYWTPLLIFAAALLPLAVFTGLTQPYARTLWRILAPLTFFLFLLHGLFNPAGQTVIVSAGPFAVRQEGIAYAGLMTSRLLCALGASLLLVFTTPPAALMRGLAQHGAPAWLTYIIGATLQIIPHMRARAAAITAAQQARGLETTGSLLVRARALLPMVTPLVLSSLVDAEERAVGLEARAFRARRPKSSLVELPDPPAERMARWVCVGCTALLIGVGRWI
ncbi:MAG: energy-coupling factor transporter transmembrane protein EcfT [Caldilinea sp.]|nr:energy-coupling factor transporter transmembrane protein EcfT [Caldilinea sp.]